VIQKPPIEIERGAGCPDGSTVDADGCIWVALYGGGAVRRYSPKGSLIAVVPLPCPNVTKLAFGGRDLKTAFVTTARTGMTAEDLHAHPDAGGLFSFRVDVPGLPQQCAAISGGRSV